MNESQTIQLTDLNGEVVCHEGKEILEFWDRFGPVTYKFHFTDGRMIEIKVGGHDHNK